ncbi:MAG TPA: GGDEF domain-containing protein [Dermatophilaceae bacterium]
MSKDQDSDPGQPPDSATVRAGVPTVPDDLVVMLDLLAQTIVQALGFGVAAINIARPDGSLEVISVAGDERARETLLGTVQSARDWDEILAVSDPWGRLYFSDHRNEATNSDLLRWIPDIVPIATEDAWHPEDALFAPLTAADGSRLGVLSVDLPSDGRRPGLATCFALEAFAVSTALAIEHATLRARAEESERSFKWLATHDPLTAVGNRSMLYERLQHAATARREHRSLLALVFIDLDRFKVINDNYSHDVGDHILQAGAHRIRTVIRPHDTVVRWGGDEFLVLLEDLDDEAAGTEVAQRISTAVAAPVLQSGQEFSVTASLGVTFCRAADEIDADELVRQADSAMYQVKRVGPDGWAVFGSADDPAR